MNIEKARKLKLGDTVRCPSDRGAPAFIGKVSFIQPDLVNKNHVGEEYVWVNVSKNGKSAGVWPSNRLG